MFLFLTVLGVFVIAFPYGLSRKEDNLTWQAKKVVQLVKKTYPVAEDLLTKAFNSGKNIADAAKEEIEK